MKRRTFFKQGTMAGAGKTMLAQRLATILPPLSLEESIETTRVYSSVGLPGKNKALLATHPVRMPHHSASGPALVECGGWCTSYMDALKMNTSEPFGS